MGRTGKEKGKGGWVEKDKEAERDTIKVGESQS